MTENALPTYDHYHLQVVSDDELDGWLARAREKEAVTEEWKRAIFASDTADYWEDDDSMVDGLLSRRLDVLCFNEDRNVPDAESDDVFLARDALNSQLATVYRAPGRSEMVIVVDEQAEADAIAWAMISVMPGWITRRFRQVVLAHPDAPLVARFG